MATKKRKKRKKTKKRGSNIPHNISRKATQYLALIQSGLSFRQLHGKRMKFNRNLVSIKLSGSYRLLCVYEQNKLLAFDVLHYSAYKNCLRHCRHKQSGCSRKRGFARV